VALLTAGGVVMAVLRPGPSASERPEFG